MTEWNYWDGKKEKTDHNGWGGAGMLAGDCQRVKLTIERVETDLGHSLDGFP